ncbi:MAG TPA: PQQ-dependent sugar dehydrogenase [Gemmatimonadaceae bacterium]|nr:PQQ-dependent sugar dehydrogenase [Gemmatimonadaceae bacterium]
MRILVPCAPVLWLSAIAMPMIGCADSPTAPVKTLPTVVADREGGRANCDADNAGLTLPRGFCALVVADLVMDGAPARARHMAITPNGDIFVAINSPGNRNPSFGIIGLRDTDGDGKADEQSQFSPGLGGSGIDWRDDRLFFGANDRVLRFALQDGQLSPSGDPQIVVSGLPNTGDHISKTVVLRDDNELFVNIGSASNACQVANRQAQSPGVFPCPELPIRAGVWLFNAGGTNQTQANGLHYATGYRNLVALAINPRNKEVYTVQHGRDMLFENWPQFFTVEEDAVLPAEEFTRVFSGSNNGWPYCYFDAVFEHRKVLAPEYGGDGRKVRTAHINCAKFNQPLATFGAHWAPNGLHFYSGDQFPRRYRGGAFIAFHGGFDRAPLPNEGFNVMFQPMDGDGTAGGAAEVFADGFAGSAGPLPANAQHRPVGVTEGPDGSLYVSDDRGGRIYRIMFIGREGGEDR